MTPDVVAARHVDRYSVWVRFADGVEGVLDLERELWGPMFEPLKDVAKFAKVYVHPELRTLVWPNGADLAPEFIYDAIRRAASADVTR